MAISGMTGTVTVEGETICATAWSVDITTDILDATDFCSENGEREFVVGLKTTTGNVTTYERISDSTGAVVLSNSNAGSVSVSGNVIFTGESIENAVDGLQTFSHDFTFNGAVTIA